MVFDQGSAAAHNDSSDVWTSKNLVWGTGFASLLLRRFRCTESGVVWGFTADPRWRTYSASQTPRLDFRGSINFALGERE